MVELEKSWFDRRRFDRGHGQAHIGRSLWDPFGRGHDMHVVVQGGCLDEEICRDKQCLSRKVYASAPDLNSSPQFILGAAGTSKPKGTSPGTASLIADQYFSPFPDQ